EKVNEESEYAEDARKLADTVLAKSYPTVGDKLDTNAGLTVFLTGATGFLGAFLLRELFNRPYVKKVIAHVRAASVEKALDRLQASCEAYGVWQDDWKPRLEAVTGELGAARLGLSAETWKRVAEETNIVIHNGAQVHWVYPYSTLRGPNVLGTLD